MSTLAPAAPAAVPAAARSRLAESLRTETVRRASWGPDPSDAPAFGPDRGQAPGSLRVGVDLVLVADVAASVERLGRRYLYRVFTPHERACARLDAARAGRPPAAADGPDGQGPDYSVESLAARFAAKEAAVKVLRPSGARPEWRSIEVRRTEGGWCDLRLTGLAASLAGEAGITDLAVSVTHEPMMAAACVVGSNRGDGPALRRTAPPDGRGK